MQLYSLYTQTNNKIERKRPLSDFFLLPTGASSKKTNEQLVQTDDILY